MLFRNFQELDLDPRVLNVNSTATPPIQICSWSSLSSILLKKSSAIQDHILPFRSEFASKAFVPPSLSRSLFTTLQQREIKSRERTAQFGKKKTLISIKNEPQNSRRAIRSNSRPKRAITLKLFTDTSRPTTNLAPFRFLPWFDGVCCKGCWCLGDDLSLEVRLLSCCRGCNPRRWGCPLWYRAGEVVSAGNGSREMLMP